MAHSHTVHFWHHLLHPKLRYSEMNELYVAVAFRAFASGLVGVFIPIYLYVEGYSLTFIGVYFLLMHVVRGVMHVVSDRLIRRFGAKHIMVLSGFFGIVNLIALTLVPHFGWVIFLALFAAGVEDGQWWSARHLQVALARSKQHASTDIGTLQSISLVATILAPFIGGVVATQFGIVYSLLLAVAVILLSFYPLFRTEEVMKSFPPRSTRLMFSFREPILRSMLARGVQENVAIYAWPIFIFTAIISYQVIGGIQTIALLFGAIVAYIIGRYGDRRGNSILIRLGSYLTALGHFARSLGRSVTSILSIEMLATPAAAFISGPYFAEYYKRVEGSRDIVGSITRVEVASCLGAVVLWLFFIGVSLLAGEDTTLIASFVFAGVVSLLVGAITKQSKNIK